MSNDNISAKMRRDGSLVKVLADGTEVPLHGSAPIAMTAEETEAPAERDPNNPPLTDADFARMKPVPRAKTLRRALGLTQEEFAARYHIPLGTLRDWEQGRAEPDQPTRAYLKVIARDPEAVARALAATPPPH